MVAPITESLDPVFHSASVSVWFPDGVWYDFFHDWKYEGKGKLIVFRASQDIPVFARAGAIIPFGPDMQYSDEKQAEEITLFVYAGQDGAFTLYEDEGVNYNYEKGKYAAIPLVYNDAEGTLTIGDRTGEYSGMLEERIFNVVKVGKDKVQAFDLKAKGAVVKYNGKAQRVKL